MSDLVQSAAVPGRAGVTLTENVDDPSKLFGSMGQLTEKTGLEYALVRHDGDLVLFSGAPGKVTVPRGVGVEPFAHTHPPDASGVIQPLPSRADINVLNDLWARSPMRHNRGQPSCGQFAGSGDTVWSYGHGANRRSDEGWAQARKELVMDTRVLDRVSMEVIQAYLSEDVALYALWMPGDPTTATITEVSEQSKRGYYCIIENDDVAEACAIHLIRSGAPVFLDMAKRDVYCDALEGALRDGLAPAAARDRALATVRMSDPSNRAVA